MSKRTAARFLAASLLGLSLSGIAYGQGGHSGHFGGSGGFHHFDGGHRFDGRFHHFDGHHFGSRVIIGGSVFVPFDYPPPAYYYPPPPVTQYVEPDPAPSAPQPSWFYCPDSNAYYPYVQQCASGWQPVAPQPPS